MKRTILIPLIFISFLATAQKAGSIAGFLVDSINRGELLSYSTVSVYNVADSTLVSYRLADDKGQFKIGNLQLNTGYRLVVNAYRYQVFRKEFILTEQNPTLDLGKMLFILKNKELREVVIIAERPPIMVRKDTIEFNAQAFKTLPTAVVEDLLKKLPGIIIGPNGDIRVNGKPVSRILVDGKEFFGGDQQIATRNLPANIIDNIQVNNDAEAMRRNPDVVAVNTPQVINLKLKRAIRKGVFGKLYGGGGPKDFLETGGIVNVFRDTAQLSMLAYGNNINKPAFSFSDVVRIGGFDRSGASSIITGGDGGFALDNISFGGLGSGVQKSMGGGANFNTLSKNGLKVNGKYFFGHSNTLTNERINDNQTLGTKRLITSDISNRRNNGNTHNIGMKLEWKADTLTTITISQTITINTYLGTNLQEKTTISGDKQLINTSVNNLRLNGGGAEYTFAADLWKDFNKAGKSFNISFNGSKKDNQSENFNLSSSSFYLIPSNTDTDQLRDNNIHNISTSLSANYTDPVNKKITLSAIMTCDYLSNENALATFYHNPSGQGYDIAIPSFSETVSQTGLKTSFSARIRWKATRNLAVRTGLVFNTINLRNRFTRYAPLAQNYTFFGPSVYIVYKDLGLGYTPLFTEPDLRYIQPVADNTDPLFIQQGNNALLPALTHRISVNLFKVDIKHSINYNFAGGGSIKNNAVIMARNISADGIQTITPVNADGIWQLNASGNFNKDIRKDKKQFSIGTGFSSNYTRNRVLVNGLNSGAYNISFTPRVNGRINLNDKLEIGETYNFSVNNSTYQDPFFRDLHFLSHSIETELVVRWPRKIVWESTYRRIMNSQKLAGYKNNISLLNAGITYLLMKNDRAQLRFAVNDMLNANVRRYAYIVDNSVRDIQTNNLGCHALLTFTYNIKNFGEKVGGKDRLLMF